MSGQVADPNTEQLLRNWNTETNFERRNILLQQMTDKGLFPDDAEAEYETEAGVYPNLPDPQAKLYNKRFLEKLLRKQEFIENRQESIQDMFPEDDDNLLALLESDASACGAYVEGKEEESGSEPTVTPFELSPTQRFIGRFLSPKSPYNSALLYHGVGVGKTCSGVTVAENFLEMFPRKQVFIIAPPTIQAGWLREIFNYKKLVISKKAGVPNTHNGCTGNTYLRLTSTEFERNEGVIRKKIDDMIKTRYKIVGYLQFYNYVKKYLDRNISQEITKEAREQEERKYLDRKFSGGLIIVDEAHNLRDTESEVIESKEVEATGSEEKNEEPELEEEADEEPRSNTNNQNEYEEAELEEDLGQEGGSNNNNNESDDDEEPELQENVVAAPQTAVKEEFAGEDKDTQVDPTDKQDILKGKKVTPLLRKKILPYTEGMKFLMLTATPMYNDYKEIILLLNLLLLNDKRAEIRQSQIFTESGAFAPGGKELLGRIAGAYVSFMRGENPLSFPIRLEPIVSEEHTIPAWPTFDPTGSEIDETQRTQVINLPFVACQIPEASVDLFEEYCTTLIREEGFTIPTTDKLIMAGNFLYPTTTDRFVDGIGNKGFSSCFLRATKPVRFTPNPQIPSEWMLANYPTNETDSVSPLEDHSPKAKFLLDRIQTTQGVCFVYSRFVNTGALTLALLLEANGYTNATRKTALLSVSKVIHPKGRQCALCPLHEMDHSDHETEPKEFVPAQYVLLTGEKEYSPDNRKAIELATDPTNFNGSQVKVILGSTIASEGIDLKFIRELFVFDSWYHLSKLEQVIGRGIRYKSHCALPPLKRNCTINLLVLSYGDSFDEETIDMYQYRRGFVKAKLVGQVTRVLKEYALDCNLNKELILIQNLRNIRQIDGQGMERADVDVNDTPYTNICDWLETCDYTCKPDLDLDALELDVDESTYDEYAAKWREHQIKQVLRKEFEKQPWRHFDDIQNKILQYVPRVAKAAILDDIVDNRAFRIRVGDKEGYIIYRNGFYLFQPELLWDENLPISLRIANFPVKRDMYEPIPIEKEAVVNTKTKRNEKKAKPVAEQEEKEEQVEVAEEKQKQKEEEQEEEEDELSQYQAFWDATVEWSRGITAGTINDLTPKRLNDILQSRYIGLGDKAISAIKYSFEMVGRLYGTLKQNAQARKLLAECLLEFVWDEYLTVQEIQRLFAKADTQEEIQIASAENVLIYGGKTLFRYVDPRTKKIVYMCDGVTCPQSIVDGAEEEDPISHLVANKTTTGALYGLTTAKDGKILFKSNDAVDVGQKPGIGRLCYSVPNTKPLYSMLNTLGELTAGVPGLNSDLDLTTKVGAVKTPARLCTLADLTMRLLDKIGYEDKKYFYRPISAVKTKHEGKGSK